MKNSAKIMALALSAILLIACCFGIGVMAEDAESPRVEILFNNLEYGEKIAILYAVNVEGAADYDLKLNFYTKGDNGDFVFDHSEFAYELQDVTVNGVTNKYPVFTSPGLAPVYMTEIVYAQAVLTVDGVEYKSDLSRFSIAEYCYKRLFKDTNATEDQKALYNHVLGFGTYAQRVMGHNVDNTPAQYFYVNAEGAVVDSVTVGGTRYDFSAGIFKAGTSLALKYEGAVAFNEYVVWNTTFVSANGEDYKLDLKNDANVVVEDKHIIAVTEIKVDPTNYFDSANALDGYIIANNSDETHFNTSIVDDPECCILPVRRFPQFKSL